MRRALLILLALITLISGSAWGQTPPVADSFIFPVKSDEVTTILDNVVNPRSSIGGWYVNNDFATNWNDTFGCCSPGGEDYPYHPGMDYNRYDHDEDYGNDVPIYSIGDGTVIRVEDQGQNGWVILVRYDLTSVEDLSSYVIPGTVVTTEIQNASSVVAMYLHLYDNTFGLPSGNHRPPVPTITVTKGQLLGYISSDLQHLHFELRAGNNDQTAAIDGSQVAGYYNNQQSITNFGNINPEDFITNHIGLMGYFSDGWHTDGTSQAFLDKYRACRDIGIHLGEPHDNGGGIYVHDVYGVLIQDFHNIDNELAHPYTSLVKGPNPSNGVFLLKEAFWYEYMNNAGWMQYGYPTSDEDPLWYNPNDGLIYTRQDFSTLNGVEKYFLWRQGSDPIVKKSSDNTLINLFNTIFQINGGSKALGDDGIYYGDHLVASFGTPIHLLEGETFTGLYALISGVQTPINQFTVTGDMTIVVGGEEVPDPCMVGNFNTFGPPNGLFVDNNYSYIVSNTISDGIITARLEIIDISNPLYPILTGSTDVDIQTGDGGYNIQVVGNYAYICTRYIFKVVDISNPSAPVVVGSLYVPSNGSFDLVVDGSYAYLANSEPGVTIVNINDPYNPSTIISINSSHSLNNYIKVIDKDGRYIYAVGNYGLLVVDVIDPDNPVIVGEYETNRNVRDIEISNGYLYSVDSDWSHMGNMEIFDISNPYNVTRVGLHSFADEAAEMEGLSVDESYVYASSDQNILYILDVSDPTQSVIVGRITGTDHHAQDVVSYGNYVYLGNGDNGLAIFQKTCGTVPAVSANFVGDPLLGVVNFDVSFHDYSTGYPTSWSWDFGDGGTSTEQNPVHTYTMHGTFDVSLTVGNGTSSDTKTVTDMIVAKKPSPPEDPRYPYCEPNPFNPTSTIRFKLSSAQHVKLEIFDLRGRKVKALLDGELATGVHQATFDGRSLASGVYFYRLTDASGVQTHKMTLLK